ncbi:tyrosine-type recombinase/integrase [Marinomonas shanghaiensis]|uniref:tyrosine-type recombinase/integrase n=1 Tax=Marinomonas shanghaiensis TaxID=2202418 RepID=UPI000DB9CF80|nr:integrase arm-type DNA-binding domain-containing protein [Marinomonas shanghaiensis]
MISDAWLKSNNGKARDKVEVFSDRDGLGVRATIKGKLVFQWRYRYHGKQLRLDIGAYPAIGLKRAREKMMELQAVLEEGRDPKAYLIRQSLFDAPDNKLEALYRDYHNAFAVHHQKSAGDSLRSMELHVFPLLGDFSASDIEVYQWVRVFEAIAKDVPSISERVLTAARQMYAWGIRMRRVTSNPLSDISARKDLRIKKNRRVRSLSDDDLRLIWKGIKESNIRPKNRILLQLLTMWGCRIGELRLAKKTDFDLHNNVWTIPPENHKTGRLTGRPLKRPIMPEMAALIKQLMLCSPESYAYAIPLAKADRPAVETSHLSMPKNINHWIKKRLAADVDSWSVHDLRSTARSRWSVFAPPHICEIALGHALPAMWQTYDHHDYLDEQRALYEQWLKKLHEIVS